LAVKPWQTTVLAATIDVHGTSAGLALAALALEALEAIEQLLDNVDVRWTRTEMPRCRL
jgi:hypothetical protein